MLQVIPTELLGDIIAVVCGEYIDGLIMNSEEAQNPESESSKIARKSEFATDYPDVVGPNALHDNPITALLQVSYQVREITLNTLSKGMSIARQQDGRLSVKPWSVIQALHQQRTQTHDSVILNLKGAEFASHFFSSYSLVALIPAALNDLGKGSLLVDLDKLQHILSLTMAVLQLCSSIKPVVFAEPVIRRVKIWAWTLRLVFDGKPVSKLVVLKVSFSIACMQIEGAQRDDYVRVFKHLHANLSSLRNWEGMLQDMKKSHSPEVVDLPLDYEAFKVVKIDNIPIELERVKTSLRPDDYATCKSLVMDILAYWVERYPQMLESEEGENAERGEPGDEGVGEREDEDGDEVDHEHQGHSDDA